MSLTSLSLVKKHVRADDFADDDEYLQHLANVAEEHVATATNRTIDELKEMSSSGETLPLQLTHAVLLLVGSWYDQREAVTSTNKVVYPYGWEALVKPFRKLA